MSYSLETSMLYPDISDILKNPIENYNPIFSFESKLHTVDKDLDYTDGVSLVDVYILRNYIENISDYIEIKVSIPIGTFLYDIYDNLDNIEFTMITSKQMYKNNEPITVIERYKAIYLLEKNLAIPNTISQTKDDLNNQMPLIITFQLLDRSVEPLRIKTTQGNFDMSINNNKDMSISTFIKSIISEQSNKILIENKPILNGINIEKPDNNDKLKAITLSSGTRVIEIPEILQEQNIGVYNGGIGCYVQNFGIDNYTFIKNIFIYSLYNANKYIDSEFKLIIFSPISSSYSTGNNTYKYKDKILKVLPYGITKINDNKEISVMSSGSGFRTSNANSYMRKPVDITPDGPRFKRNNLNSEIVFKHRKDGLNFAPNKSVSGNQFKLTADLLRKNGSYITVEISNMDHDFIYPAAKCKILYENKEKIITEIFGVVHLAIITYSNPKINLAINRNSKTISLTTHASLQIFINSN